MAKSYIELLQERARLDVAIEAARKREAAGVISRIRKAIEIYDISGADIGFGPDGKYEPESGKPKPKPKPKPKHEREQAKKHPLKGRKLSPKYSDGNGNTWAGGGYTPKWLVEKLAEGKKLEDFLINKAA